MMRSSSLTWAGKRCESLGCQVLWALGLSGTRHFWVRDAVCDSAPAMRLLRDILSVLVGVLSRRREPSVESKRIAGVLKPVRRNR